MISGTPYWLRRLQEISCRLGAVSISLLLSTSAIAHPLDDLEYPVKRASELTHLPRPPQLPEMHSVSSEELQRAVCKRSCQGVKAGQVGNHIYYDERLDLSNSFVRSIIIHEYVHYLQWYHHGVARDCQEYADREREAYLVQTYLFQNQAHILRQFQVQCPN